MLAALGCPEHGTNGRCICMPSQHRTPPLHGAPYITRSSLRRTALCSDVRASHCCRTTWLSDLRGRRSDRLSWGGPQVFWCRGRGCRRRRLKAIIAGGGSTVAGSVGSQAPAYDQGWDPKSVWETGLPKNTASTCWFFKGTARHVKSAPVFHTMEHRCIETCESANARCA